MLPILLGQALLLTFRLADQSMWTDEMFTVRIVHSPTVAEALAQIRLTENRPPLHYLALWGWARIVGRSEWGMRVFSVLATLLATVLVFRLACCLTSPRAALWAAFLSASAPTLLWHGRMMRGYAVAVPFALLSTLAFWRAWCSPGFRPKLAYLFASASLLFIDYLTIPIVGAHVLYFISAWLLPFRRRPAHLSHVRSARRREILGWLVTGVGLLVVVGGLGLTLRWQGGSVVANDRVSNLLPAFFRPVHLFRRIPLMAAAAAFVLYSFSVGEAIYPWHPLALPATLAALMLAWSGLRQMGCSSLASVSREGEFTFPSSYGAGSGADRVGGEWILVLLIAVPLAFTSVVIFGMLLSLSMLVIAAARSLYLGPILFIPMGVGLSASRGRHISPLLLAILLAARTTSLLNQASGRQFLNPVHEVPVRELAAQVARNVQPGDVVVFEEPLPFDLYFRQLDAATPLFTPGSHHIGHRLGVEVPSDSPAFLGQGEPYIPAIAPDRLLAYLRESRPCRLWLVVFHHEGSERTIEQEIGQPLVEAGLYHRVSRLGYAPQDPLYARLRAWLRPRTPIQYKAEILLYIRPGGQNDTCQDD